MVTQAPRRGAVALALIFVMSCVGLTMFVWSSLGGSLPLSPRGYEFHVLFSNASQLSTNADVRIAGVDIGKVVQVTPSGLRTDATIELTPQYAPLASDARAILRQKTLLGETFVEMTPGSARAARLPDGGRLPPAQVAPTQPLDRILGAFDAPTRRNFLALLTGGSTALTGRGADLNDALGNLDPVSSQLAVIVGILDRQRPAVRSVVADSATVLSTIASRGADVRRLVDAADTVLTQTAVRDGALTATVDALAPFLSELRSTLDAVDRSGRLAAPSLAALAPATPLVRPALVSLGHVAPRFGALMVEFGRLLPTAERALPATARLLDAVRPFVDVVYPTARQVTPVIDFVDTYRRELLATFANVAAATEATAPSSDGTPQHYLRTLIPMTEESLLGYTQRLPSNRHNPYFAPGELSRLNNGGLQASDCANLANPQTVPVTGSGAPPCVVQPPWNFQGVTRYFPHVGPASP